MRALATYIVLAEEAKIAKQAKIDEKRAEAEQNAGERKKTVVKVAKLDRDFAYRAGDNERVIYDDAHVPQIEETKPIGHNHFSMKNRIEEVGCNLENIRQNEKNNADCKTKPFSIFAL